MANKIDTLAVHAGAKACLSDTRSKVSPIFASSVWSFDSLEQVDDVYEHRAPGYVYSRISNPGVEQLEQSVALLEAAEAAAAYSSGMAAIAMALLAELKAGDHVVAHQVLYGGSLPGSGQFQNILCSQNSALRRLRRHAQLRCGRRHGGSTYDNRWIAAHRARAESGWSIHYSFSSRQNFASGDPPK